MYAKFMVEGLYTLEHAGKSRVQLSVGAEKEVEK